MCMFNLQETLQREKYLLGFLADEARNNNLSTTIDPFDKQKRPLQLVVGNWSACSATCGDGVRKRKISCEIITNNYFEVFELKTCKHAGIIIPKAVEKCSSSSCTRWVMKEWSPVSTFNRHCLCKLYTLFVSCMLLLILETMV